MHHHQQESLQVGNLRGESICLSTSISVGSRRSIPPTLVSRYLQHYVLQYNDHEDPIPDRMNTSIEAWRQDSAFRSSEPVCAWYGAILSLCFDMDCVNSLLQPSKRMVTVLSRQSVMTPPNLAFIIDSGNHHVLLQSITSTRICGDN